MITRQKLVNTFAGVMLPGLADVIGIFSLKQFIAWPGAWLFWVLGRARQFGYNRCVVHY